MASNGRWFLVALGEGILPVVERFGLTAVLDRHEARNLVALAIEAVCHACGADVDLAPHLRESEIPLIAQLSGPDEAISLRAWTRLMDGEPWLCKACLLL